MSLERRITLYHCVFSVDYGAAKYLKVDEYLDQVAPQNVLNMSAMQIPDWSTAYPSTKL